MQKAEAEVFHRSTIYVCNYDDIIDQGGGAFWRSGLQRLGLHNSQVLLLLLRGFGARRRRWHKYIDGTTSGTVAEKLKWLPLLLVINERSHVSSKVLAAAEQNIFECILVSRIEKSSGEVRLPAILLFGDD